MQADKTEVERENRSLKAQLAATQKKVERLEEVGLRRLLITGPERNRSFARPLLHDLFHFLSIVLTKFAPSPLQFPPKVQKQLGGIGFAASSAAKGAEKASFPCSSCTSGKPGTAPERQQLDKGWMGGQLEKGWVGDQLEKHAVENLKLREQEITASYSGYPALLPACKLPL